MLRIKFTYFNMAQPTNNPMNKDYYFASEALDYQNIYWEPRIVDPFDIERFFDVQSDTTNRIRTVQVTLDNSDGFLNQFMTKTTTFLNNFMTLYYDNGNGVTKSFTGKVQSIDGVSSTVRLTLREFGYEYLENTFPDAQIAYDYYSDSGINDSWNCIPIHFGVVKRIPLSWVNSFYSEFIIGSGPILSVDKVYIDDDVVYDATQPNQHYKPTEDSKEIYVRIFRGRGWDADGKRETVIDRYRPETLDPTRETVSGNNVTHISQWGGFAYIQLFSIDDNGYEIPAYPYNTDGALGQVYVDIHGIVKINKTGTNTYSYTNTMVQNPAEIIKLMFCQPELVSEGPCAIGWGYKESDVDFAQAIKDCGPNETINGEEIQHLNFVIDGSFDTSGQFGEALKVILQCCRGYIVEENGKITLKIDKAQDINTPVVEFDEEGITGFDCNLEEWNEPDLDSQTNRIRLNYDWSQEFKRYNKKPDANHESPDYKKDPDYDTWLTDQAHCEKVQKWNTEELELKMVSDTTTAHRLAIYYLRKKSFQHIQGTLSCANSAAMNLDAGDLIGVKSKQFNWYKNDTGGTDPNKGKVFQITSIKKGDELTDIDFIEYDPAIFIADTLGFNLHEIPSKIENLIKPATPTSLTLESVSKEYAGTTICEINGTVVYASNSNKLFATVRYFDYGTSTPANDYTPPEDANWITYGNIDSNKFTISGLTPGHWYFIQVYTVNANGSSAPIVNKVKSLGDIIPPGIPTISHTFTNGRSVGLKIVLNAPPSDFRGFMLFKDGNYITSITTNIVSNKATCEYTDICENYNTKYRYKATTYDKWNNISQYSTEISVTTPEDIDISDIAATLEHLQDDMEDTNTRIDEYVSDDVLSVGEKARLAEDWLAIRDSRYNKVKSEAENHYFNANFSVYNQDYLNFVHAYEALEEYVDGNGSTINLTPTPPAVLTESRIEGVGSTVKKKFSDYYDMEIKVLSDIDKDNKNRASTIYAECYTAADDSSKITILPDVVIFKGLRLCVKFFNGNTTPGILTLNIKRTYNGENLINGGKFYHNAGYSIPVLTFEAGTTITLVLTEKTEVVDGVSTTVQAWEFSDSSILGLGEKEISLGNLTCNLGMVNGNRIIAESVNTEQLAANCITSEKLTSEQIIGKDFRTAEDVGTINSATNQYIQGIRFDANGIKGYGQTGQTFSIGTNGMMTALAGEIGGWRIGRDRLESITSGSKRIVIKGDGTIYTSDFATGVSGWRIDSMGNAEFNSAIIRGKIQSAVFEYDKVSAIGGKMMVKPASVIFADSTHVNTSTTVYVKDSGSFAVGECFYIKQDIEHMFYGLISAISTQTLSDGTVIGVITYSIPSEGGTFFEPDDGQSIINYGNPMSGGIMFDGRDGYIDIYKNHTVSLERDYNIYDPILNINAWGSTTASIAEEDGVIDISGEDNHGQAFGGVTVVKDKVMGKCFYFDRSDSTDLGCLSFINHANLFYGMTKLSLTFTFKATSLEPVETNTYAVPFLIHSNTGAENTLFGSFAIWPDGHFATRLSLHTTTNPPEFTGSVGTFETNKEYCLILTSDFTINKTVVYLNGVKIGECQSGIGTIENPITTFNFGSHFSSASYKNYRFKGLIKDFRIFDKVLTPEEVQVIYKQSLVTPYINSNMYDPILNLDADYSTTASIAEENGVVDVSGNQNNGQAYGGVSIVNDNTFGNVFDSDGTNDTYMYAGDVQLPTEATLHCKVKLRAYSDYSGLISWRDVSHGIILTIRGSDGLAYIGDRKSNAIWTLDSSSAIPLDTWVDLTGVFSKNGSTIYINGVKDTECSDIIVSTGLSPLYIIGRVQSNGVYDIPDGQITDIKIFDRALTAEEVYNVYQQSLNPEAFENPEKLISYDEINVHHFSGDAIQLDHLVRLGNLKGIADITDDRYGIFLGDERSYLKYDSVDGLKLINSNFALDGSILSDNFLWIDGNGNVHDDINMEIASDVDKGITNGQRYTEEGSMLNMTSGAFVTPNVRFDNRGSFYTKSKAFFENPDNVSTFFDVKYTTIESKGNIVLYDYQDNYEDSTSPYEEGPGTIAMFTLGAKNESTGLRTLSGIKLNGSLNSYQNFPSMMTLARTTSTTVDDNGNVSSYTINKSSTVSHPYWLPVIQMSNLIYDNNTDKTDLYVDASVYPTALTGSNKTLNLGSSSYRWSTFYSNYGSFGNVSGNPNSSKVEIGLETSYGHGIRIYKSTSGHSGIMLGGNDLTSNTGTSANSWYITNENGGIFKLYKNTTAKLSCDTNGNWTVDGSIGSNNNFTTSLTTGTYLAGNRGTAIINSTAAKGYTMLARMKSTNGVFTHGVYNADYQFYYTADSLISAGTNNVTKTCLTINEDGTVKAPNGFIGNVTGNCSGSSGSCTGNAATATKATQDGSGNTITSTYATIAKTYDDTTNTSYRGMRGKDGANNAWVRTTSVGIIPYQAGNAGSGHCGLGTSSWYFATAYIDNIYGKLNGNCTGSSASCTGNATTATTATNANGLKVTQTTGSWLPLLGCVAGTTSGKNSSIYSAVHTSSTGGNIAMTDNANGASAASYIQLGNSTACSSSSTTGRYGRLRMYGTNTKRLDFYVGNQTTNYDIALLGSGSVTLTLPSSTGTVALTSQIPATSWCTTKATTTNNASSSKPIVVVEQKEYTLTNPAGRGGYRKWSDGFKEEWGTLITGATYTLKCGGFSNTNYTVTAGYRYYNNNLSALEPSSTTAVHSVGGPSHASQLYFYCAGY